MIGTYQEKESTFGKNKGSGTKVVLKMDSSMEMLYTFGSKTENTKCTQDYMKME